jgi:hypothetical protein
MTPVQIHAVKQAYSDAFSESMKVCAVLGGVGVLVSLLVWRRVPVEVGVRRREQVEEDKGRREGMRRVRGGKGSDGEERKSGV